MINERAETNRVMEILDQAKSLQHTVKSIITAMKLGGPWVDAQNSHFEHDEITQWQCHDRVKYIKRRVILIRVKY